jgi:Tol biopolymer transport system component
VSRPLRFLFAALAVAALIAASPIGGARGATATAASPAGPRLAVNVFRTYPRAGSEVLTMGPAAEAQERIAGGPGFSAPAPINDTRPAWSPDGSLLSFFGPNGEAPGVFLVDAEGSHLHVLKSSSAPGGPHTFIEEAPVFDQHGNLVVAVYKLLRGHFERPAGRFDEDGPPVVAIALWVLPADGSKPHALGPFQRKRVVIPYAFAPNGTMLAAVTTRKSSVIATIAPGSGAVDTVIAHPQGAEEPVFSPDGSQIAYLHDRLGAENALEEPKILASNLMVVPASGGTPRLVARIKGGVRWPAWDPSGSRLSFTKLGGGSVFGTYKPGPGNSLMAINADGTCLTKVFGTERDTIYGASWQPGADRGAGPISC